MVLNGDKPILIKTAVLESKHDGFQRCTDLVNQVFGFIGTLSWPVGTVFIENYSFHSVGRVSTLVEIGTMIRFFLLKENFKVYTVAPTTLKKFVTGKGNCKGKGPVILSAYKQWGFELPDDDRCDAACLAVMAAFWSNAIAPHKYMQEALEKVTKVS